MIVRFHSTRMWKIYFERHFLFTPGDGGALLRNSVSSHSQKFLSAGKKAMPETRSNLRQANEKRNFQRALRQAEETGCRAE